MVNNEEELTDAEIKQKKDEMMNFYKESMPYLEAQLEYEDRLMQIDEVRFKRFQISMQTAMMANPPEEEDLQENQAPPVKPTKKAKKPLRTE